MRNWINIAEGLSDKPTIEQCAEAVAKAWAAKCGAACYLQEAALRDGTPYEVWHEDAEDSTEDYPVLNVYVKVDGRVVGSCCFDVTSGHVRGVDVSADYRRKGIATVIYDYLEKTLYHDVEPSYYLEPDGVAFWKARRPNEDEEYWKTRSN